MAMTPSRVEEPNQPVSPVPQVPSSKAGALSVSRWWVYQRERFPVLAHGPLIAAFSYCAVSYSSLVRGYSAPPAASSAVVAFASALLFFLQLRISDEFKDYDEDCRYRPYRPVPRGLVSLRELGIVALVAGAIQLALAVWLSSALAILLVCIWLFVGLMRCDFFVPNWLKARPAVVIGTHMLIVPLVDFYATACDWLPAGRGVPAGLFWFLLLSYTNGTVLELGRKIRAPEDEEPGVDTYSALWGRLTAVRIWLVALGVAAVVSWRTADRIGVGLPVLSLVGLLLAAAAAIGGRFLRRPSGRGARCIEAFSGIWTLVLYLSLGAIPRLLR
jgi:4-hydroxybenzoate polyprenyltransferase and related prenyltransferases